MRAHSDQTSTVVHRSSGNLTGVLLEIVRNERSTVEECFPRCERWILHRSTRTEVAPPVEKRTYLSAKGVAEMLAHNLFRPDWFEYAWSRLGDGPDSVIESNSDVLARYVLCFQSGAVSTTLERFSTDLRVM